MSEMLIEAADLSDSTTQDEGHGQVDVVIVVPVYRHSVFVADAVMAAASQDYGRMRIVVVNDGCPHPETERTLIALQHMLGPRLVALRQKNSGLSAARNTGVDYAIARWPETRAFYFLDADNLIAPSTISRAYAFLTKHGSGWVYPDVVMFGSSTDFGDYSGPYSPLRHLQSNLSEAGSMVSRAVFDAGCRYDEQMRQGLEDWEFWWQCIGKGFRGRHLPRFGLRYRKRPESMLAESERVENSVLTYMRQKHRKMLSARSLLRLEGDDVPRYARLDDDGVHLFLDPRAPLCRQTVPEFAKAYARGRLDPWRHERPAVVLSTSGAVMAVLEEVRLDRFVLNWIADQLRDQHFVGVEIVSTDRESGLSIDQREGYWPANEGRVHVLAGQQDIVDQCLGDPNDDWVRTLLSGEPQPKTKLLQVRIGSELSSASWLPESLYQWFRWFKLMHPGESGSSPQRGVEKVRYIPNAGEAAKTAARVWDCGPLLPVEQARAYDICFALPLVAFGGVEKVALRVAQIFRQAGWRCHLLVFSSSAHLDREWIETFDSIMLHDEGAVYSWSQEKSFLGSHYPSWGDGPGARTVEGYLLPMNVVFNFHVAALHAIAAKLRRSGVVLCASLHVNDKTSLDREVGHPFLAIGYEHVYDFIAPCSESLGAFCHAMGVPRDKIVTVRNAPGYEMDHGEIVRIVEERRPSAETLKVLFVGRFDRQKGLDRLVQTIETCREAGLPIEWRLVGRPVLDLNGDGRVVELLEHAEEPVHEPAELSDLYQWADVLFVPSHWEGLPLTVLEAQRLGCVPLVTDVGAVAEVVRDGENGFILPYGAVDVFADRARGVLEQLYDDRDLLARVSANAVQGATWSWANACSDILRKVTDLVALRAG